MAKMNAEFAEWHKSKLPTKEELLLKGIPEHVVATAQKYAFKSQYHVEKWHSHIEACTMPTVCLKLSREDTTRLSNAYSHWLHHKELSEDSEILLEKFEKAIQGRFPNGFFVKLNSRSPKDVSWLFPDDEHFIEIVKGYMDALPEKYENIDLYMALNTGLTKCMHLHTAKEALMLLIRSHRICEDLTFQGRLPEEMVDVQAIFREWDQELAEHPEGEYRCFVYKNKLTCIGQYFADCYRPEIVENKEKIKDSIYSYLTNDVIPNLTHIDTYVIDVWYGSSTNLKIVELNPFAPTTGAGLFSWKTDGDLFVNGPKEGDVEIRVLEDQPEDILGDLPYLWKKWAVEYKTPQKTPTCSCSIM